MKAIIIFIIALLRTLFTSYSGVAKTFGVWIWALVLLFQLRSWG